MSNPTIFISGASRGIGLEIAKKFYANDFTVIICSRNPTHLKAAKESMPNVHTYVCDISDKNQVIALAETLNQTFGAMHVLVNNGGVFKPGQLHSEEDTTFESTMATNVHSAYYFTKKLSPLMIQKKKGTIVNMCSVASIRPYENGGSYCISKYALLGFGKVLREEMKPYNIRVINVLPGATLTDSWAGVDLPETRFIPAEDIAQIVWDAYKMSDRTVIEEIVIRPMLGDI